MILCALTGKIILTESNIFSLLQDDEDTNNCVVFVLPPAGVVERTSSLTTCGRLLLAKLSSMK